LWPFSIRNPRLKPWATFGRPYRDFPLIAENISQSPTKFLASPRSIMPKPHTYKFCFGPWNISEGQDPYGPTVRPPASFDWKLAELKRLGFDAMMFHDDDAVPEIDSKSEAQIRKE